MKKIYISELFGPTIQGEGPNVGRKSIFVRVAGCDFKCTWCDSKFTWNINKNEVKGYLPHDLLDEILKLCKNTYTSHVILTGGNPCLYNFTDVINGLHLNKITVDIETQGSVIPSWLNLCDLIVISPKPPSSGQKDVIENIKSFTLSNASKTVIKVSIFSKEDISFLERYYKTFKDSACRIYASVGNNILENGNNSNPSGTALNAYRELINKILFGTKMESITVLPQLHVLVWGNKRKV